MNSLRYSIGDKLYANVKTDFNFKLEVKIVGIADYELAESRYESIILKMYQSNNGSIADLGEAFKKNTLFYICEVLKDAEIVDNTQYLMGDIIILCDDLIDEKETYFLSQEAGIFVNVTFSKITSNYADVDDLIADMKRYLESKNVETVEIFEELSYEQKLETELNEYRNIISSIKSLKGIDVLVDKLNTTFNSLISRINSVIDKLK